MELFRLLGTIAINGADKAQNELEQTVGKAEKSSSKIGQAFKTVGLKTAKYTAMAVTTLATGVAAMAGKAVSEYAEYEQLVGGVETLFKDSKDLVVGYANDAYKSAGMSANEYMETVTGFSASLLQSLNGDTEAAAERANMAITDMSDNANKMGTSMESLQNAYSGFAKQNYTMLDNLKLGYGGTKEEMQRLLKDAEKLSGVKYDISSYGDIVAAIHLIQGEMGITGTTIKEASTTIQGSIGMMKAAWTNFLTGAADPTQDFQQLLDNLVDSVITAANNIVPRIAETVPRLVKGLSGIIGTLIPYIAPMLEQLLPALIDGAGELLQGLMDNMPAIVSVLEGVIPEMIEAIVTLLPQIIETGINILVMLIEGLTKALPQLIQMLPQIIVTIVNVLTKNLPLIIKVANTLVIALAGGLIKAIPEIVKAIPEIISAIVNGLASSVVEMANVGKNLVEGLWKGIGNAKDWILNKVKGFGKDILDGIKGFFGIHSPSRVMDQEVGQQLANGIIQGISNRSRAVADATSKLTSEAVNAVSGAMNEMDDIDSSINVGTNTTLTRNAQAGSNDSLVELLMMILEAIERLENKKILWNNRELGRLVESVR